MNLVKKNYHWIIVTVILLELGVYLGLHNNITSLYIIPVTEGLGITRGSASLAYSARNLFSFLSTLFSGVLLTKFGYRKLASLALLIIAGAYGLLGSAQSLLTMCLACAVMGLCDGFCSISSASRMVNTWFHTHQGLIWGLVTASTGFGGSLFSIILSRKIEASGWRSGYYLSAILIAVTAVCLFLIVRNRPGNLGLLPYGSGNHHGKKPKKESKDHWYGYEPKDIFRKPIFFLTIFVVFMGSFCIYAVFQVIVPHLQDCGMNATDAAAVQSILLLGLAGGKLLCGFLCDYLGAKRTTVLCIVCTIAGIVLLNFVNGYAIAVTASVIFSIGLVFVTVPIPMLSSALFGYHPQGSIMGIFMALPYAASMASMPIVNSIYDRIGSYSPIFWVVIAMCAVVLGVTALLFILADRDRAKYESGHPELQALEEADA